MGQLKKQKQKQKQKQKDNSACVIIVAVLLVALFRVPAYSSGSVTVVYTGETQAMLESCECPDDPGGGLAERAGFLNERFPDRGNLLLIDGGGFSGGGIYDIFTGGRAADSLRTVKAIAAMGVMGYDAVGIGDDDLQYGGRWLVERADEAGLPLVCANCFTADGEYLAQPYIIVKRGGHTFGITSVVTSERLFPVDTAVIIRDPFVSLESIRKEMKRKSDHQILISHLGEEETGALLRKAAGFLLAANGHRKMSVQPLMQAFRTPVLNYGFQGKQMSYAVLSWQNRALRVVRSGWFAVDGRAGVCERAAAAVYTPKPEAGAAAEVPKIDEESRIYDLYIMSLCPYSIQALGELAELIRAFPQREWNVWFIGTAEGDKLLSLRGHDEMFDEMLWLGVKALYPFRYHEFLFLRAFSSSPTEKLLDEMDLDVGRLRKWADDMGSSELRQHYLRSMRLNISASPTLLVNNKLREKPIGGGRLVRDACHESGKKPAFCGDYPECFEDGDCIAYGKVGSCVKDTVTSRPTCRFRDDANFALTALVADLATSSPEKRIIEEAAELLPGARVNIVKLSSDEGKRIMARYSPAALPFIHFDANVANAHRYAMMSEMLVEIEGGGFTLKKGKISENYYPQREEKRGAIELYVDPLMPDVGKIIDILVINPDIAKRVAIRPIVSGDFAGAAGKIPAQGIQRTEEALRWLVLAEEFPKKYLPYLKLYGENPDAAQWLKRQKELRINKKKFNRYLEAKQPKIAAYSESLPPVLPGEAVIILINNRSKTAVTDERELVRALKSIVYYYSGD